METLTINSGNCVIEVWREELDLNPRKGFICYPGKLVCFHSKYDLGDENPKVSPEEYLLQMMQDREWSLARKSVPDDIKDSDLKAYINKHFVVVAVYLYDHSGLAISTTPFSCRWDSGQVGFIWLDKESKDYDDPVAGLKAEIETLNQYLQGDVWGFTVYSADGDKIESVAGFYGLDNCKSEAIHIAQNHK